MLTLLWEQLYDKIITGLSFIIAVNLFLELSTRSLQIVSSGFLIKFLQ